jgi:uncharacterized OsmC-like protein
LEHIGSTLNWLNNYALKHHLEPLVSRSMSPERGGTDAGPLPLSYFVAGAASCLMTQYAKLAIAKNVPLTSLRAVARGHFDRRVGGAFKDIIYEIAIETPASADAIHEIAREAELMCYAHNTLKNSVHMETNLTLNGERLDFRR